MTHRSIEARDFTAKGADTWLFCIDCTSFFQHRDLRRDTSGKLEKCPFCEYAGFGFGIFPWDAFREGGDWPASEAELVRGAKAPPPMNDVGPAVAYKFPNSTQTVLTTRTRPNGAPDGPRPNRHARRAMAAFMRRAYC